MNAWDHYLNKSVPIWTEFINHWQKCLLKYANIGNCIHILFEDANNWSAFVADGSPHMHLCRVLWSGFVPEFQTWLCTAESPMSLYLHCSFIAEDSIWAVISFVLSCPFQSLNLVDFTYHLAVNTTTVCPPKLFLTFQCSGYTYMMTMLSQHFLQLLCCCLVIFRHLLIHKCPHFSSYLWLSTWALLSANSSTLSVLLEEFLNTLSCCWEVLLC